MKRLLLLLACGLSIIACTKEEAVSSFYKPKMYLDSCVVSGNNEATVYIRLDKGENFFHQKVQLVLYDIDNPSNQVAAFDVPLRGERVQEFKMNFTLPSTGKAFLANLVMKTDKNSFVSNTITVTHNILTKENFHHSHSTPHFDNLGYYAKFCTDDVGMVGAPGERRVIVVKGYIGDENYLVKIGGNVVKTENEVIHNEEGGYDVWFDIPDLPAGKYDVTLIWRGIEIPLEEKLQILPWYVKLEETCSMTEFENLPYGTAHSYCIGNKMYYCSRYIDKAKLVAYDFETKKWENLNEIPYRISAIVEVGNKAYATTNNYRSGADIQEKDYLVEYDPKNDTWKKLAEFPNNGNMPDMNLFAASGNLYMCDGTIVNSSSIPNKRITQVWKYDLKTGEWKAMGDLPSKLGHSMEGWHRICYFSGESMGYAMDCANGQLWTYHPETDKWTYESVLKNQLYGAYFTLMEYNGKLLYFGYGDYYSNGENSSAYTYDFDTHTWELLAAYQWNITNIPITLPMMIYNNKLTVGPFRGPELIAEHLYFLTVDIK